MEQDERHYRDLLGALKSAGAEFLVVGAHALAAHGIVRGTDDFDVWVRAGRENAERVWRALHEFGAPTGDATLEELAEGKIGIRFGGAAAMIDVLTSISGVGFEVAWARRVETEVLEEAVAVLNLRDILENKKTAGRPKDLVDVAAIEARLREQDEASGGPPLS